jgi:predicted dehydrogenase
MTLRVGYVGLDHHHAVPYLDSLARLDAEVVSACEPSSVDPDPVLDAAGIDVPTYDDLGAMLDAEAVDVAWLTLPNGATPGAIEATVEAGVDVFTEKPAARTAAELAPVIERVRPADVSVGVSYPWRGHPVARDLRERAADGFYGDVRSFESRFYASRVAYRDPDHYLFDPGASRGGILQWLGVHWLDLLPWLLDDPIEGVYARTATGAPVDVEDGVALTVETASGVLGTLQAGYYLREERYDTYVGVQGSAGRSAWDPIGDRFGFDGETTLELEAEHWTDTPCREITYEYDPGAGYGGTWGTEFIGEFLEAFDEGREPPVTLTDARVVLGVLDAAYASAERDRWVAVEPEPGLRA